MDIKVTLRYEVRMLVAADPLFLKKFKLKLAMYCLRGFI